MYRSNRKFNAVKGVFVVILCAGLLSLVACGTSTNTANEGKGTNNNESK